MVSFFDVLLSILLLCLLWLAEIAIVRLYFHPLSKFPGPRTAALSRWYEFYHDILQGGTWIKQFPELHNKHGPIIRVSPDHLHVNDPNFYKEVFSAQTVYLKAPYFYASLGVPKSLALMIDPKKHRLHRNILNPLFSKTALNRVSVILETKLQQLTDTMERQLAQGKHIDVHDLYRRLTVDIISRALFNRHMDLVGYGDEYPPFLTSVDSFSENLKFMQYFPILQRIALKLPLSLSEKIAPGYASFRRDCTGWVQAALDSRSKGTYVDGDTIPTIFDLLLEPNPEKGYEVPTMDEIVDEAFLFMIAGIDNTSIVMAVGTFHILRNEEVLAKLREELRGIPRENGARLGWRQVSNLPYLAAVVKESLRISSPTVGVLPRIVPPSGVYVQGKFIPGGTIVSTSTITIHTHPDLFPNPSTFLPSRWLGESGKELEKWMVAFSKGPRQCIAMNMAYMEIQMTFATIFKRFDDSLELFETDETSLEWVDHGQVFLREHVKVKAKAKRNAQEETMTAAEEGMICMCMKQEIEKA